MLIDVGSSERWVKICVEPTQSGLRAAWRVAYWAALINSGSPGSSAPWGRAREWRPGRP